VGPYSVVCRNFLEIFEGYYCKLFPHQKGGTSVVLAERRDIAWCATVHIQSWEVCSSRKRFHVSRPEILAMDDLPL